MTRSWLVAFALVHSRIAAGEVMPAQVARAVARAGEVRVDGRLDEAAWAGAPIHGELTQRFPQDGARATQATRFALLYDDDAIYVGVWADDPSPAQITRRLAPRDADGVNDSIMACFDSERDRRTAYCFQLAASGSQRDIRIFDDASEDATWDARWQGAAAVTAGGWTAELRVPLDQLRLSAAAGSTWGFQLSRRVGRTGEQDAWAPWPRSGPAIVSRFGTVTGLPAFRARRRLWVAPYGLLGVDVTPIAPGDPPGRHVALRRAAGLDLAYGLGPALTLSATINPDFGQIEADPATVNLTGTEQSFAENRPFFVEGAELFRLPLGSDQVDGAFYSRRIGGAPPIGALRGLVVSAPTVTAIHGAVKLTGKAGRWSVGVLDAVASEESATVVDDAGATSSLVVAPLTNYAVARAQRALRDGATAISASATAVHRALAGTGLAMTRHDQAYTGGLQLQHRWADDAWAANLSLLGSWVHGSAAAITATQRSLVHLFQRPDAPEVQLDATRRSLAGLGLTWSLGRSGNTEHWRYLFGGELRTPGLELNDAGLQRYADRVAPFVRGQYHDTAPGRLVLDWTLGSDVFVMSTFGPRIWRTGVVVNGDAQLANHWQVTASWRLEDRRWEPTLLRGGPVLRSDPRTSGGVELKTDPRARVVLSGAAYLGGKLAQAEREREVDLGATVQLRSDLALSAAAIWTQRTDPMQYIAQVADGAGTPHFVFGEIRQTALELTLRASWTLSPRWTLQAYARPYLAAARYRAFKDVDHPDAARFADRFHVLDDRELTLRDGTYHVARDGGYAFASPDFGLRELRSMLALRWEYLPGSTISASWSYGRSDRDADGRPDLGRALSALGAAPGESIVLLKLTYGIGL